MIRLTGCLLIIIAGSLIGSAKSRALKDRTDRLKQLMRMLVQTSELIRYRRSTVGEIMAKLNEDQHFRKLLDSSDLLPQEKELLSDFLSELGTTDTEGQLSMIAMCSSRCSELIAAAKSEETAKCRLYEQLGFMCGAFIAVLLI